MSLSNVTFVTAYLDIYQRRNEQGEDIEFLKREPFFADLAKTGICLVVFIDAIHYRNIRETVDDPQQWWSLPNVYCKPICKEELPLWLSLDLGNVNMPHEYNHEKDTKEFLLLSHCKYRFVEMAMELDPFKSGYFGWIDFNLTYIFNDKPTTLARLSALASFPFQHKGFLIPGCRSIPQVTDALDLLKRPHWYYCGGIFIADKASMVQWCAMYPRRLIEFITQYNNSIVWDFNFYSWLDLQGYWNEHAPVHRYLVDTHNDSMITHIDMKHVTVCLTTAASSAKRFVYDNMPSREGFAPMNSSFSMLFGHDGTPVLNTRYVNYVIDQNTGLYMFPNQDRIIRTRNLMSILDPNDYSKILKNHWIDGEDEIIDSMMRAETPYQGLEDIRLFHDGHQDLKFVASSLYLHNENHVGIVMGKYDPLGKISDIKAIRSPFDRAWEKNWCPIQQNNGDGKTTFVYQWSPYTLVSVSDNGGELDVLNAEIQTQMHNVPPMFNQLRGSTCFMEYPIEFPKRLVGLVHLSDEKCPREYFHMIVHLDKETLLPVAYSQPFYFVDVGIEFCIGFSIKDGYAWFWISRFDRDPELVRVGLEELPHMIVM